jgi:DNA-binding transcriptional ArsR family regulator
MLKAHRQQRPIGEAHLFAALGDSTRLELIRRLGRGESDSIATLSQGMKLSRQGVTKHLRVLETAGVVTSKRVGRELQFALQPKALTPLQEYLDLVSAQWNDAAERLRSFVENPE